MACWASTVLSGFLVACQVSGDFLLTCGLSVAIAKLSIEIVKFSGSGLYSLLEFFF